MNTQTTTDKLEALIAHIDEVKKNCQKLGFRLIENGELDLGRKLIAHGFTHDNSKFGGIEWERLTHPDDDDDLLPIAIRSHVVQNEHHPEFWGGIKNMPRIALAEMVCDWKARSSELGSDMREWIATKASKKFKFSKRDKVFKDIMEFVELLLEQSL